MCSSSVELIEVGLVHGVAAARFSSGFQKVFQNCDVVLAVAGVREVSEQQDSSLVIKKLEPHFSCAHTSPQLSALSGFLS